MDKITTLLGKNTHKNLRSLTNSEALITEREKKNKEETGNQKRQKHLDERRHFFGVTCLSRLPGVDSS